MLDRPTTSLKLATKRNGIAGDVIYDDKYPPAYVKISIDANDNHTIQNVVHELIHVVIAELVIGKFDYTLEEVVVLSLESYIWNFISSSPARLKRWEKLIAKKLAENPQEPETPLEELADRRAQQRRADEQK